MTIRLIAVFLVLILAGFLFLKYFDSFLEARFNLNIKDLNIEYLKSKESVLDISIFDSKKFNALKTHKMIQHIDDIKVKNNPFEDYSEKDKEEEEQDDSL